MPRPVGTTKTGGRQKGVPNRKTQDMMAKCEELGVDPFTVLCLYVKRDWEALGFDSPVVTKVLKDGGTIDVDRITTDQQIECAKEVCQYLYAKKRAVELSTDEDQPLQVSLSPNQLVELVRVAK